MTGFDTDICEDDFPTNEPSVNPTNDPTNKPTVNPSVSPTENPSTKPTVNPSRNTSKSPSQQPTTDPTDFPTYNPTSDPSKAQTSNPTTDPTDFPTWNPANQPPETIETPSPTPPPDDDNETNEPVTGAPTNALAETTSAERIVTIEKTVTSNVDDVDPTEEPQALSMQPTKAITKTPTMSPTELPTESPTDSPTDGPTCSHPDDATIHPTVDPTISPTAEETEPPAESPTTTPTRIPTKEPSILPTSNPSVLTTERPSATWTGSWPSSKPTAATENTLNPTSAGSAAVTLNPTPSVPSATPNPTTVEATLVATLPPDTTANFQCGKVGEFCSTATRKAERCCGGERGGYARCLFDGIGEFELFGHKVGKCCVRNKRQGCTDDTHCCNEDDRCYDGYCMAPQSSPNQAIQIPEDGQWAEWATKDIADGSFFGITRGHAVFGIFGISFCICFNLTYCYFKMDGKKKTEYERDADGNIILDCNDGVSDVQTEYEEEYNML